MKLELMGIDFYKDLCFSGIDASKRAQFIQSSVNDGEQVVLRSKKPFLFLGCRFRIIVYFQNEVLKKISLVAVKKQFVEDYIDLYNSKELQEKWLISNYGLPDLIANYGYRYYFDDLVIQSEYDPRSGSAEIFYIFS